ncbi:Uncharacterised protein [uncultured archaeon]|nr:Uncharacterised protein [uncultured archaeon]
MINMIINTNECIPLQKWKSADEFKTHISELEEHKANGDEGIWAAFDGMKNPIAKKMIGKFNRIAITFPNSTKISYICKISKIRRNGIPKEKHLIPKHYFDDDGSIQSRKTWYFIRSIEPIKLNLDLFRQYYRKRNLPDTLRASFQYLIWLRENKRLT